jgi:hypothetical protein
MHTHRHKHIDKKQAKRNRETFCKGTERFSALANIQHLLYRLISVVGSFRPLNAPQATVQKTRFALCFLEDENEFLKCFAREMCRI